MYSLVAGFASADGGAVSTFEYQFRWGLCGVTVVMAVAILVVALRAKKSYRSGARLAAIPAVCALLAAAYVVFPGTETPAASAKRTRAEQRAEAARHPLLPRLVAAHKRATTTLARTLAAKQQSLADQTVVLRSELRTAIAGTNHSTWAQLNAAATSDVNARVIVARIRALAAKQSQHRGVTDTRTHQRKLVTDLDSLLHTLRQRPPTAQDTAQGERIVAELAKPTIKPTIKPTKTNAAPGTSAMLDTLYTELRKTFVVEQPER